MFARKGKCSHLGAGIRALDRLANDPGSVNLVRVNRHQRCLVSDVTFWLQCVRRAPSKKPDLIFRFLPLESVVPRVKTLAYIILFDPLPLQHQILRKRCFCHRKSDTQMCLCDTCWEWYHFSCVGLNQEEAQQAADWKCGYCRSQVDHEGMQTWNLEIPQGKRKRVRVAKPREASQTPRALGIEPFGDDLINVGPRTWDDIVLLAQEGGKKIREAEARYKRKAAALVKEGGHHIVDQMSLGGVVHQGVTKELVADLIAVGELEEEEDGKSAADDENEDD